MIRGLFNIFNNEEEQRANSVLASVANRNPMPTTLGEKTVGSVFHGFFGFFMKMFGSFSKMFGLLSPEPTKNPSFNKHSKALSSEVERRVNQRMKDAEQIEDDFIRNVTEQNARMELVKELRVEKQIGRTNKVIKQIINEENDLFDIELGEYDPNLDLGHQYINLNQGINVHNQLIKGAEFNKLFNSLSKLKEFKRVLDTNNNNHNSALALGKYEEFNIDNNAAVNNPNNVASGLNNWENNTANPNDNTIYNNNLKNQIRGNLQLFLHEFITRMQNDDTLDSPKKYYKEFEVVCKPIFNIREKIYKFEENLKRLDASLLPKIDALNEKLQDAQAIQVQPVPLAPLANNPNREAILREIAQAERANALRQRKIDFFTREIEALKNIKLNYIKKAASDIIPKSNRIVELGSGDPNTYIPLNDPNNRQRPQGYRSPGFTRNIDNMNEKYTNQYNNMYNSHTRRFSNIQEEANRIVGEYRELAGNYDINNLPQRRDQNGNLINTEVCDLSRGDRLLYEELESLENNNILTNYETQINNAGNRMGISADNGNNLNAHRVTMRDNLQQMSQTLDNQQNQNHQGLENVLVINEFYANAAQNNIFPTNTNINIIDGQGQNNQVNMRVGMQRICQRLRLCIQNFRNGIGQQLGNVVNLNQHSRLKNIKNMHDNIQNQQVRFINELRNIQQQIQNNMQAFSNVATLNNMQGGNPVQNFNTVLNDRITRLSENVVNQRNALNSLHTTDNELNQDVGVAEKALNKMKKVMEKLGILQRGGGEGAPRLRRQ